MKKRSTRLFWILIAIFVPFMVRAEPPEGLLLIAHRGVVDETRTENSLASLEETIRRGYTHIEVDIRSTKDGHAVCLHDSSLDRTTGLHERVHNVTLAELRAIVSEEIVPSFETFCARSAGRIDLMPDLKDVPPSLKERFAASIRASMHRHGLVENALFIGRKDLAQSFLGKSRLSWGAKFSEAAASDRAEDNPGGKYFIFGHAKDFDQREIDGFHSLGLQVVVSINLFHYTEGDPLRRGLDDIQRMLALGVDGLQIDSAYDTALFATTQ